MAGKRLGSEAFPVRKRREQGVLVPSLVHIPVSTDIDVVTAYMRGQELAAGFGFSSREVHEIAMAVSEVARNIVNYAGQGDVSFIEVVRDGCRGLQIVARDHGPGIADVGQALAVGFSTGGGLGLGLPVAAGAMDEFDIVTARGQGTTVTMLKWCRSGQPAAGGGKP
jgi:serine/threonine-protein kinase RsbT